MKLVLMLFLFKELFEWHGFRCHWYSILMSFIFISISRKSMAALSSGTSIVNTIWSLTALRALTGPLKMSSMYLLYKWGTRCFSTERFLTTFVSISRIVKMANGGAKWAETVSKCHSPAEIRLTESGHKSETPNQSETWKGLAPCAIFLPRRSDRVAKGRYFSSYFE